MGPRISSPIDKHPRTFDHSPSALLPIQSKGKKIPKASVLLSSARDVPCSGGSLAPEVGEESSSASMEDLIYNKVFEGSIHVFDPRFLGVMCNSVRTTTQHAACSS